MAVPSIKPACALTILHTAQIGGAPLRFYRSPAAKPDFPWHAVNDLYLVLNLPADLARHFRRKLKAQYGSEIGRIRSAGGVEFIAPHFMAQGLIGAMVDVGQAPPRLSQDYAKAGLAAFETECDVLGVTGSARAQRCMAAATGIPDVHVEARFDPVSGQQVYRLEDLQAALGMSAADAAEALREVEAFLPGHLIVADPSRLQTIQ